MSPTVPRLIRSGAAIGLAVALAAGCGSDDASTSPTTTTITTVAAAPVVTELVDGLTIGGVEVDELRANTSGCDVLTARAAVGDRRLHLAFHGEDCAERGDMEALNGNYGDYLSPDDVDDEALASDVTVLDHPLGTIGSFDHAYVECTNECITDVSPMVLLELDRPVVVDGTTYPTIVLRGDSMTTAELLDVAATIAR